MRAPREADVTRGCLQLLALRKITAWRANQIPVPLPNGKGFRRFAGLKGVSDIVGVLGGPVGRGRILCVETKRPGGRLSPEQAAFLDVVRAAGGLALCVSSVDGLAKALDAEGL